MGFKTFKVILGTQKPFEKCAIICYGLSTKEEVRNPLKNFG